MSAEEVVCYGMIETDDKGREYGDEYLKDDPDEVIQDHLEGTPATTWDRVVIIAGYKRMPIFWAGYHPLEEIVERLDDEYGHEECEFVASEELVATAEKMLELLKEEYVGWGCEEVIGQRQQYDLVDWVRENEPDWIEEDEDVAAFVNKGCDGPWDCDCVLCVNPVTGKAR